MGDEYREIVDLGPVSLAREDLQKMEDILTRDLTRLDDDFEIIVLDGSREITAHSVSDLLQKQLPPTASRLLVEVRSRDSNTKISAGLFLTLYHNYANYQIHAQNQALFLGKKAQLDAFFRSHMPWYAPVKRSLPIAGSLLFTFGLFAAVAFTGQGQILASVLSALLALLSGFIVWLGFSQKVFPYVRVRFTDDGPKRSLLEIATLALTIALFLATIANTIALVLTMKSK